MTQVWKLIANDGTTLDLTANNITVLVDDPQAPILGNPVRNPLFSQSIDNPPHRVGGAEQAREYQIPLKVGGGSATAVTSGIQSIAAVVEKILRYGGKLRWRSSGLSYAMNLPIEDIQLQNLWSNQAETTNVQIARLAIIGQPWAEGDPYDVIDDFSTDTFGTGGQFNDGGSDWTVDAGASGNVLVSGGQLTAVNNLNTANNFIHTGTGNNLGDAQVTVAFTPGTTTNGFEIDIILKRIDANNYLLGRITDNGTNTFIRILKVVAGVETQLATTTMTLRITTGIRQWIKARIQGNNLDVISEALASTAPILPKDTIPNASSGATEFATYTLSSSEATQFGSAITGYSGLRWIPKSSNATIDDFQIRPFTYFNKSSALIPDTFSLNGGISGDIPAKADFSLTNSHASIFTSGIFAWMPKPGPYNYVWNEGFEIDTSGWVATAVAGVTGAATSITRLTASVNVYEGASVGQIITPATTDTGASFLIARRFRVGVTYTAEFYGKSLGGSTTPVRCKLGQSGDIATGSSSALTNSYQKFSVTWTPTLDREYAYVVAGINAATATTFQIDRVVVYEGTTPPFYDAGYGGYLSTVQGGLRPFGILRAGACDPVSLGAYFTLQKNVNYLNQGWGIAGTGATASNGTALYRIAPPTITADDTSGVCLVDVYARVKVASTITSINIVPSLKARGSFEGNNAGSTIYSIQYGSSGKNSASSIPSSGTVFRPVFIGTLPIPTDNNLRQMEFSASFTIAGTGAFEVDYFMFVPSRRSCSSSMGVPQDSNYASLFTTAAETEKQINDDLTGQARSWQTNYGQMWYPDTGMVGDTIRLDTGVCEVFSWVSDYVIDRTDTNATNMTGSPLTIAFHAAVTPRYYIARQG